MKGMRGKFQNKRGRPVQRPMGKIVLLVSGNNGSTNRAWRFT
jgi:hypothetical protein